MLEHNTPYAAQQDVLREQYAQISSLKFSTEFETKFRQYRRTSFIEQDYKILLMGAIVYVLFFISDIAVLPAEYTPAVVVSRFVIALLIFIAYYFVRHVQHQWFRQHIFHLIAFILLTVTAHVSIASYFLPQPYHMIFMLGIVQIYIVAPALLKPDSKLCFFTLLVMLLMSMMSLFFANKPMVHTQSAEINQIFNAFPVTFTFFLAGLVAISAYLAYTFEKMIRKNWLDNQITELKSLHLEQVSRQLLTLSQEDALTELANRRHFQETLSTELARTIRSKEPTGLLMLDIDDFKLFNDAYGHQAGDICLQHISNCLKHQCNRSTDLAARYGGEEFVIMLPNTDLEGSRFIADNICQAIQKLRIKHASSPFGIVTMSIGVAVVEAGRIMTIDTLIQHADTALYQAKARGKNQVVTYQAGELAVPTLV